MTFYVYAYLRNKDSDTAKAGTPYYIGKGSDNRAYGQHRVKSKGVHVPTDDSCIVFLENNLTEIGAFALERRMIRWYGRKDLGTGILHNRTDGGDGTSGRIVSEETKRLQSLAKQGKPGPNKGSAKSQETKDKISKSLSGNIPWNKGISIGPNPEHSERMKGQVPWNKSLKTPGVGGVKKGNIPWNKKLP